MLGKLTLRLALPELIREHESANSVVVMPVTREHIFELTGLPHIHGDPFDRLLIATARTETATLLSADPIFQKYPVPVIW